MIGIGWVNDELVSDVETVAGVVVTDSSVVGNVDVPLAFTVGADEVTTAVSVVGNNGGALADGDGELAGSTVCVSGFSGSAGGLELIFSVVGCWSFICCCNVCTSSLSDRTSSRSASTSALVAGVETAGGGAAVWAERRAAAQMASATHIKVFINFLTGTGPLTRDFSESTCLRSARIGSAARGTRDKAAAPAKARAHQWSGNRRRRVLEQRKLEVRAD